MSPADLQRALDEAVVAHMNRPKVGTEKALAKARKELGLFTRCSVPIRADIIADAQAKVDRLEALLAHEESALAWAGEW